MARIAVCRRSWEVRFVSAARSEFARVYRRRLPSRRRQSRSYRRTSSIRVPPVTWTRRLTGAMTSSEEPRFSRRWMTSRRRQIGRVRHRWRQFTTTSWRMNWRISRPWHRERRRRKPQTVLSSDATIGRRTDVVSRLLSATVDRATIITTTTIQPYVIASLLWINTRVSIMYFGVNIKLVCN